MSMPPNRLSNIHTMEQSSQKVLEVMSRFIGINTLFVAKNDRNINEMIRVVNRERVLVEEGSALPFEETLCNVAVKGGNGVLVIPDLFENEETKNLDVTKSLGGGCFIGIPIYYENGENYGTICGLDTRPYEFQQEHIELFQTMASLLTSVIEAERMYEEMYHLSVPIVPIAKGVAIVPIIGNVSEERVEFILERTLQESQRLELRHLVIDLSGVVKIDGAVAMQLSKIIDSLKLLGVTAILTGMRADLAIKAVEQHANFEDVVIRANLEQALQYVGLHFTKQKG